MTLSNIFCKKCKSRLQFIYYYDGKSKTANKYQAIKSYMICPNHDNQLIKVKMKTEKFVRYMPVR